MWLKANTMRLDLDLAMYGALVPQYFIFSCHISVYVR